MNILPLEIQFLIINQVKCYCVNICKTWEKILNDNLPNNDVITHIINKDYYAIQFIFFNFPLKTKEKEIINVAIIMNDSLIYKIILNNIYKILPVSDSVIMYFRIDYENSTNINNMINHIIIKGNYNALQYFLDIHNNSGFPDNLIYMSDITNIISKIKKLDNYQFDHFMMIDYLIGLTEIDWCDDDVEFIIKILSSSFDKFYDQIKSVYRRNQNTIKFVMLIDKLINKQTLKEKKVKKYDKYNVIIKNHNDDDKKAYLECIRHGFYNIIKNIPLIEINNLLKDDNEFTLFLLSISGNCDLKNIVKFYHVDYHIDRNKDLIKGCINKLDIEERYSKLMMLIKRND